MEPVIPARPPPDIQRPARSLQGTRNVIENQAAVPNERAEPSGHEEIVALLRIAQPVGESAGELADLTSVPERRAEPRAQDAELLGRRVAEALQDGLGLASLWERTSHAAAPEEQTGAGPLAPEARLRVAGASSHLVGSVDDVLSAVDARNRKSGPVRRESTHHAVGLASIERREQMSMAKGVTPERSEGQPQEDRPVEIDALEHALRDVTLVPPLEVEPALHDSGDELDDQSVDANFDRARNLEAFLGQRCFEGGNTCVNVPAEDELGGGETP